MRALLLIVPALVMAGSAFAGPDPTRDVLWAALKTCVLAKRYADRSFPCHAVDLGNAERPGTAILRAPGRSTHFVVMPTDTVSGVEAPVLRGPIGAAYWRAALAARHLVSDAARDGLAAEDVGLAVNSVGGRSQDQLHIHLACVHPGVTSALQHSADHVGGHWSLLPMRLMGSRFFALRVDAKSLPAFNPFAALGRLPGRPVGLRDVSLAMVPMPAATIPAGGVVPVGGAAPADHGRDVVLLAYRAPNAHAEKLLDTGCTAVR
ncbi:CDP-diacylglycerol diphosphatase [Methylobacterium dankookense]|uniref:CDP-diacylglycerol pyrophosphatase n=1 Tax=Methylobacterium dankookense TaxID=560405 RepID=A0A564G7K8_9HYPH|nr:CDP-diacylglycerol diphosphatase [Methylobacterium dankookense]GJD56247.1 CDP-diacylglycerol pyrophosphatase [Methylobacterium dankookense]VUF15918.1 putative CDP-diacylglycerol pyrophosphatase [Methylobacterium dankookense]